MSATAEHCEAGAQREEQQWPKEGRSRIGRELGIWKLKWGRIRIPRGLQLGVNVDCGCERVGIVDVSVGVCTLCPPCESGQAVAEPRAHCEAASKLWRQCRAAEERT